MRFNLISDLIIMLLIILHIATTNAATECDDANSKSDVKDKLISQTSADDIKWAADLAKSSLEMVWQNLQEKFQQQEQLEAQKTFKSNSNDRVARQFAGLYIFVSTSMPKLLLKAYLREASKYGGVLVFKGLPKGSFKELIKLVLELTSDQGEAQDLAASMQIDDEVYAQFQVVSVPTIVLSQEDDYHPNQTAILKFDKMVGNVGVKYALEEFGKSGELTQQALEHLNCGRK